MASPTASTLTNIGFCLIGVLLGTLIGVLPGIGATATIAMLLPITFQIGDPVSSLIMLAGIYYGAQYGGSTTAILINMPGESSSAVTAIDGYQMARQGRAGVALATAAIGSFVAGTIATVLIALFAPPLTAIALKFGSAEYCSLMIVGLVMSVALAHGSVVKAIAMVVLGLLLGLVGQDVISGASRLNFGLTKLGDQLNFVAIAVGLFGIAEILRNLEDERTREVLMSKVTGLMPTREDFRRMVGADPARHRTRVGAWHIARQWRCARRLRLLFDREARFRPSRGVRARRDRRRRRTGIGQQCGRADLLHPDVDAGHPGQSGHGADDRRHDYPGHSAGAQRGRREPRLCSGG